MSAELQQRAKTFLKCAVPKGINYVPGSFAEQVIAGYAKKGKLDADPEFLELLEITVMDSEGAVAKENGEAKAYFTESCEILRAILSECASR